MKAISVETLSPITHNSIPVITTEFLARLYGSEVNSIKVNHSRNQDRFVEGKHYFKVAGDELKVLRVTLSNSQNPVSPKTRSLILWTERGAARHAKMLETDQAWEVFEKLEDCYFSQTSKMEVAEPATKTTVLVHFDATGKVLFTEKLPEGYMVETIDGLIHRLRQRGYIVMHKDEVMAKFSLN